MSCNSGIYHAWLGSGPARAGNEGTEWRTVEACGDGSASTVAPPPRRGLPHRNWLASSVSSALRSPIIRYKGFKLNSVNKALKLKYFFF